MLIINLTLVRLPFLQILILFTLEVNDDANEKNDP